ncbi:MAG TPA: hypothetical protein VF092_21225 [Longimicrobium sp.]
MNNVFFGIANDRYDTGDDPAVAINRSNQVVEVHESDGWFTTLWYNCGHVVGSEITWTGHGTINDDDGHHPSVAVNDSGVVVEAHDSGDVTLWYWVGQVKDGDVTWSGHDKIGYSGDNGGITPGIAIDNAGHVVEVHDSGIGELWYWVGQVKDDSINWTGHGPVNFNPDDGPDDGYNPSVAINASGQVLEVHESGLGDLWYWAGQLNADNTITWTAHGQYDSGTRPTVALGDDGFVVETHTGSGGSSVYQRLGQLVGSTLTWTDWLQTGNPSHYFDDGVAPSVAFRGGAAVQVHTSEWSSDLFATASLYFDRASWMQQYLAVLGATPLNRLVLPASHDAAMYPESALAGKTQDLDVGSQLRDGVRWFDLRPADKDGTFYLYHGNGTVTIWGPPLSDVLAQIAGFMQGHAELVLLKFSHFQDFTSQSVYDAFFKQVYEALSTWIRPGIPSAGTRLGAATLSKLLEPGGNCVVLQDSTYSPPSTIPAGAIRRYRDWCDSDADTGDLTVFDVYSNTIDLGTMIAGTDLVPGNGNRACPVVVPQGQLLRFAEFTGICRDGKTPCDLFLLSWTLTPVTAVWPFSREANASLGPQLASEGANAYGSVANLLYTDYVEYARSADVALVRNGCASAAAPPVAVPLPAELPQPAPVVS